MAVAKKVVKAETIEIYKNGISRFVDKNNEKLIQFWHERGYTHAPKKKED